MESTVGKTSNTGIVIISVLVLIIIVIIFIYIGYKNSQVKCKTDSDCALTDICNTSTGVCQHSSCFANGSNNCIQVKVVTQGATNPTLPQYWCIHGKCVQCFRTADCQGFCPASFGSICQNGVCTGFNPSTGTCSSS